MISELKRIFSNLRESLWFIPGLMIAFSILLAFGLIELDSYLETDWLENYPRFFGLGADGSRGMLTAIASSMLTVATLAFSLTLNAITQASGQFTPRILRNFMRDRANQFVLGYFVSVFAFCLIVLRTIRGGDEIKFVPSFSVLTGLFLALGGILVLIYFIHHIAESLQITKILDNISIETKRAVDKMFPEKLGDAASKEEQEEMLQAEEVKNWKKIPAIQSGFVQNIDSEGLLNFAEENEILLKMRRGIGEFVWNGAALVEISNHFEIDEKKIKELNKFFTLDRHRTIEQDIGYGIRQIVDIALKALSPGINDTTTALVCLNSLGEILGMIAERKMPIQIRSKKGVSRVIAVAPNFENYVEAAFDQIRINGKGNFAVFDTLLITIGTVSECTNEENRRKVLLGQVELINEYSQLTLETEYEKGKVRRRLKEISEIFRNGEVKNDVFASG